MQLPKDKKILVLRYGTNIEKNCIRLHQEVLENKGSCWFGKLGRSPSEKVIKQVMNDDIGHVILYAREGAFLATFDKVIDTKPDDSYPEYYETLLYADGYIPSMYFRLLEIEPLESAALQELIVSSSKSQLIDTLYKSMNSFFCVEYKNGKQTEVKKEVTKAEVKKEISTPDGCIYRKDKKCHKKGFVNYQYECERPNLCVAQKL